MTKKRTGRERENHLHGIGDRTERKRAEQALGGSEEQWRSLVENIPDIIMTVDADGTILFINRAVPGFTVEGASGTSVYDYVPPEYHDTMRESLEGVFEAGDAHDFEIAGAGPFGRTSWYFNRIGPVVRDGRVVAATLIATDITEQRRAEEALRESEGRYRHLVEDINDITFAVDETGRITYISPVVTEVGGYSPSEMVGQPFADFLHPDDVPSAVKGFQGSVSGDHEPVELRFLSKSGELHWVRSFGRPILEGDRVVGLRGVLTDITERKRAEEALRQSEERYRTLVEAAPDVIYSLSRDGIITSLNSAFESISGWSRAEWLGKHFAPIIHPDDLPAAMEDFRLVLRGEVPPVGEYRILVKSGQYLTVEIVPRPLIVDGKVVATFGIARDISERKRMEEALQSAREELESAVERQMQRGNAYGLTFREFTVLYLVADGRSDKEIGAVLGISNQTAHKHVASILSKMSVASRTEASVRAVREGFLD